MNPLVFGQQFSLWLDLGSNLFSLLRGWLYPLFFRDLLEFALDWIELAHFVYEVPAFTRNGCGYSHFALRVCIVSETVQGFLVDLVAGLARGSGFVRLFVAGEGGTVFGLLDAVDWSEFCIRLGHREDTFIFQWAIFLLGRLWNKWDGGRYDVLIWDVFKCVFAGDFFWFGLRFCIVCWLFSFILFFISSIVI